ncbi:MAG: hypothetical protein ACE5DY_07125 [Mariprofundaceae bacterium]
MENFDMGVKKLIRNYFNHGEQQTDSTFHKQPVSIQASNETESGDHDAFSRSLTAGEKDGD